MNEYRLRRQLMQNKGMTWDEAEDELNNIASDEYDRWRDEWDNNVREYEKVKQLNEGGL